MSDSLCSTFYLGGHVKKSFDVQDACIHKMQDGMTSFDSAKQGSCFCTKYEGTRAFNPYVSAAATHIFIIYSATVCIPQVYKMETSQFRTQTSYCQRRSNSITLLHFTAHLKTELSENPTPDIPDIRWVVWRTYTFHNIRTPLASQRSCSSD